MDITEGIPKEAVLSFCRGCERFASPPNAWVTAQPESRELLGKSSSSSSPSWHGVGPANSDSFVKPSASKRSPGHS